MAISSPTTSAAVQGLVQRQNQSALDGAIAAVMANGELIVSAQGRAFVAPTVLDDRFQPGEPVILARSDEDEWVIVGVGTTGTVDAPGGVSPSRPPTGVTSQSLHEAILRLVNKRNQILRKGTIIGVFAEGTLIVRLGVGDRTARAATTQRFEIGSTIYALVQDDGAWLALGSR